MSDGPPSPARRFNPWPYGVVAFFVAFILFTIGLVTFSTFHGSQLVAPDYYDQEMRFQDQINRVRRTTALQGEVGIQLLEPEQHLRISLPAAHVPNQPKGSVTFYRPSASGLDRRFPLLLDAAGRQTLDVSGFAAGLWRVRVAWNVGAEEYYREAKVVIGSAKR